MKCAGDRSPAGLWLFLFLVGFVLASYWIVFLELELIGMLLFVLSREIYMTFSGPFLVSH